MVTFGFRVFKPLKLIARNFKHVIFARPTCCFLLLLFTQNANSQKLNDYVRLLTSGIKQTWRLDSVTLNSSYGVFKKGEILLFKLSNEVILSQGPLSKK